MADLLRHKELTVKELIGVYYIFEVMFVIAYNRKKVSETFFMPCR